MNGINHQLINPMLAQHVVPVELSDSPEQPELTPIDLNKDCPERMSMRYRDSLSNVLAPPPTTTVSTQEWTKEDDNLLIKLRQDQKLQWEDIAKHFPGRTPNQCKYRWSRMIAPKNLATEVSTQGWTKEENEKLITLAQNQTIKWKDMPFYFHNKTVKQCENRWFDELMPRLFPKVLNRVEWTKQEDEKLTKLVQQYSRSNWAEIAKSFPGRQPDHCRDHWRKVLEPELQGKEKIIEEENGISRPNKRLRIELSSPFHGSSQLQENSSLNNLPSLQNVQGMLESSLHHSEMAIKHLQEIQSMYAHPLLQSIQQETAQCLANVQTTYKEIQPLTYQEIQQILTYQEIQQKLTKKDCSSIIKQAVSLANFSLINAHRIEIVYQHFISYQTNQELKEWFSSQSPEFLDLYLVLLRGKINEVKFRYLMSLKEKDYYYDKLNHLHIRCLHALRKNHSHFSSHYKKFVEDLFSDIRLQLTLLKHNQGNWKQIVSILTAILLRLQEIEVFFQSFSNNTPSNAMESNIVDRIKNKITLEDFYKKQASLMTDTQEGRRTEDTIPFHESSQLQEGMPSTHSLLVPSDQDFSGDFPEFLWSQENLYSNDCLSSPSHPEDSPFLDLFGDNPPQE